MSLGDQIKAARKAKKWSQAKLGSAIGVTSQAVSGWERGEDRPARSKIAQLSQILDIPETLFIENASPRDEIEEMLAILGQIPAAERKLAIKMLRAMVPKSDEAA